MSGQISRLTTVAHVLYDREVLELGRENARLREENERLRQQHQALTLKLFWKEHSVDELKAASFRVSMNWAYIERVQIIWRPWIEPILQACGLEVEHVDCPLPYYGPQQRDLDTHLVCGGLYIIVAYGAKLLKAKSVDDPELLKLKALFKALKDIGVAPYTHTTT
jgi:hypothetical protein